jgi:cathepsin H
VADGFKDYKSGIYSNSTCPQSPDKVNHAVLAVGFDSQPSDYWIIKNSWGP